MTRYVGLDDVHREMLVPCIIDCEGNCLERHRIELSRSSLERFAKERLRADDRVALEATTNTWAVVDVLEPHVERVERRKKGALLAPMQRRTPGERIRKTAGLAVVYDSEGLPKLTPSEKLPAGERRVLKAMNLESLPDQLQAVRCRTSHHYLLYAPSR